MNRLFKYTIILLLIFTSGLLFIFVGLIENHDYRYKIYELFQIWTSKLFNLVDWKFNTQKDNTILVSNYEIAPIVNLISAFLWTSLVVLIYMFSIRQPIKNAFKEKGFWTKVMLTNLILSGFLFLFWLFFMNIDFIYEGVYTKNNSVLNLMYKWIVYLVYLPSLIPSMICSVSLDNGGDTLHGYEDMYLMSKTITSFGVTIWSVFGVLCYEKVMFIRKKNIDEHAANIV
jgi:hypothetical protein